jgi:hypothetical protein
MRPGQHLNQNTLRTLPRHDGWPVIPALEQIRPVVHAQPGLLFLRGVAIVATLSEKRLQLRREINLTISGRWESAGFHRATQAAHQSGNNYCGSQEMSVTHSHSKVEGQLASTP